MVPEVAAADLVLIPRSRGTATRSAASNASSPRTSPRPVAGRETLAPRDAFGERDVQACAMGACVASRHQRQPRPGREQREGTRACMEAHQNERSTARTAGAPDRPAKARSAREACDPALENLHPRTSFKVQTPSWS